MKTQIIVVLLAAVGACTAPDEDEIAGPVVNARTVVSLTFDDTFADNVQVGDMAADRGMRVVFYVNSSRLGRAGYMTVAQLRALEQSGHEIGGHTLTHVNLTSVSSAQARMEICDDRAALLDAGFRVTSFAYPFGADNPAVQQIVADCGYNSARDVGGLRSLGACPGCPWTNTVPPTNLYALRTNDSIDDTTTLETMQQYVLDAESHGGGYVPIVFHHVCDGCSANSVSPALLAAFLDWLQPRAPATEVGTVDEEIGGPVQPRVSTTDGLPMNLLRNPSLETGASVPDCWQHGHYGTNTATYAFDADAADGARAQNITISSYTSGGSRLVSKQDTGACAPAVTPGHRYTMTAAYKASVPPRITMYYRTTSGQWVWFGETAPLPTSSSYVDATYTTPPMPADATAISGGLGIFAVGSITMDAYRLVDLDAPPPGDTTPPPPNLLANASLESDGDGNGVPDCWQRGGFGTNTATFALTSDAFDGARAESVTVTSLSSGARRLVSAQDSGACAPAVVPGRQYAVTAYYKASVQPRFSVYYRSTSGSWLWLAESPLLPAATAYARASYITPAMPSDATAISVGLSIFSVGALTTDAYTLTDVP